MKKIKVIYTGKVLPLWNLRGVVIVLKYANVFQLFTGHVGLSRIGSGSDVQLVVGEFRSIGQRYYISCGIDRSCRYTL